jgi:hypothetical protein
MTNDQTERLIAAVERLAAAAEALVQGQQRKASSPAKFIKPIEEFPCFDWSSIGARIEFRDSDRIVAAVSWEDSHTSGSKNMGMCGSVEMLAKMTKEIQSMRRWSSSLPMLRRVVYPRVW